MSETNAQPWNDPFAAQLAQVLAGIDDPKAMQSFLRDVLTTKEIIEVSARLQAAKMLEDGETYARIIQATKLSSRTVARISDWLQNGAGGYAVALQQTNTHSRHTPPARAA